MRIIILGRYLFIKKATPGKIYKKIFKKENLITSNINQIGLMNASKQ